MNSPDIPFDNRVRLALFKENSGPARDRMHHIRTRASGYWMQSKRMLQTRIDQDQERQVLTKEYDRCPADCPPWGHRWSCSANPYYVEDRGFTEVG